ncbi:PREDICTED: essential MCU regulator, mitochondrial-like [Lipotes vexillifer]|uniref:Essential MCU regulator, mitochondrial n=1 Tax=Lipotes vexillifer TaxID=118797 RepID=A0A340WV10_LIPVE|nr:PREDICTED: essential MCU regulator, mitochondrial-like [Lipotes vexillifer]
MGGKSGGRRHLALLAHREECGALALRSHKTPLYASSIDKMSFGLLRVFSIVIPFLHVGMLISKNFAALLEEHDIFVPEDDDDDD